MSNSCLNDVIHVAGAIARPGGSFGVGTGAIIYHDLNCFGTEARLADCQSISTHNCVHAEDAGVVCQPPSTAGIYSVYIYFISCIPILLCS